MRWSLNKRVQPLKRILLIGIITFFALLSASCNGCSYGIVQPNPEDLCKCLPVEPDILDFRHVAKHVPIPAIAAQEIGVDTILSWTQDAFVAPDAPRTGAGASSVPCGHRISPRSQRQLRRLRCALRNFHDRR